MNEATPAAPEGQATPSFANSPDSMWLPTQGGSGTSPNWFGLVKVEDVRKAMTMIEARELSASAAPEGQASDDFAAIALATCRGGCQCKRDGSVAPYCLEIGQAGYEAAQNLHTTPKPPAAAPDVEPMHQTQLDGIKDRHAYIESGEDSYMKRGRSRDMAYLSHLDRGELLVALSAMAQRVRDLEGERDEARDKLAFSQETANKLWGVECERNEYKAELLRVRGDVAHAIQDRDGWHRNYQGYRRDFEALYGLLGIPNSDDSGATKALVSRVKQLISLEKNHG